MRVKVTKSEQGLLKLERFGGIRDHQLMADTDWLSPEEAKKTIPTIVDGFFADLPEGHPQGAGSNT